MTVTLAVALQALSAIAARSAAEQNTAVMLALNGFGESPAIWLVHSIGLTMPSEQKNMTV